MPIPTSKQFLPLPCNLYLLILETNGISIKHSRRHQEWLQETTQDVLGSWKDQKIDTIPLPSSQLGYSRGSTKVPIALYMSLWLDSVYKTVVVHLVWVQVPLPWDSSATVPAPCAPCAAHDRHNVGL